MPADLKSTITWLVSGVEPADDLGRAHRRQALRWLAGTDDIFRRVKPRTPSPHLVSYFLPVDRSAGTVLLCDHRLSGLWLPPGGHVEPGEHPLDTVRREAAEELGVPALPDEVLGEKPFFLTMTETVGPPDLRHVDVSFWFALTGDVEQHLQPDQREFAQVRWWTPAGLRDADPGRLEPHLLRALDALGFGLASDRARPASALAGRAIDGRDQVGAQVSPDSVWLEPLTTIPKLAEAPAATDPL